MTLGHLCEHGTTFEKVLVNHSKILQHAIEYSKIRKERFPNLGGTIHQPMPCDAPISSLRDQPTAQPTAPKENPSKTLGFQGVGV